ncbi:MAG: hypothetical protein GY730_07780 [bacterium]|nr:hypothetical protein [bacterium]
MRKYKIKNYNIIIHDRAITIMNRYRQLDSKSKEAGGILLGQIKGDEVHVLTVSEPNEKDKRQRFSFERDKESAQSIIDYKFNLSDGHTIYLGEWHSHPEKIPYPSDIDRRMIVDQYHQNIINEDFLLLYIIGTECAYLSLFDGNQLIKV